MPNGYDIIEWILTLTARRVQCGMSTFIASWLTSFLYWPAIGFCSFTQISFDNYILITLLNYASSHQVTIFQLGLAIFYAFLFKLTHRQNNLYIACVSTNRYRSELQNMIELFVATLSCGIKFHSFWLFDEFVKHVREKCLSILEHSHYPLHHILAACHLN